VSHARVLRPADGRRARGVRNAVRRPHARASGTDGDGDADEAAAAQARAARRAKREEQMATKQNTLGGGVKMVDKAVEERCGAKPHPLRRKQPGQPHEGGHASVDAGVWHEGHHLVALVNASPVRNAATMGIYPRAHWKRR